MASAWSRLECEAIVADYFNMLAKEARGEPYSKAEHRRSLQTRLDDRSEGSIEYKHQNISAALIQAGHVYIRGYKPAWNYQSLLEEVVLSSLESREALITEVEDSFIDPPQQILAIENWTGVFVEPPARDQNRSIGEMARPYPRKTNFAEREKKNRLLGEKGEEFVLELERQRLSTLGRLDLAKEIEWTSKEKGDSAGYDIRSFKGDIDEELFIEVKTTNSGIYQPFLITSNEVSFSADNANSYSLYRLFDFSLGAKLFELKGSIQQHVTLTPKTYSASF